MRRGLVLAFALLLVATIPAAAQDDAVAALERAEGLMRDARTATDRRGALRDAVRAYEDAVAALAAQGAEVSRRERDAARALAAEEARIRRMLAALVRVGQVVEPSMLATAEPTADTLRAGLALGGAAEGIAARSRSLADRQAALAALRTRQSAVLEDLVSGRDRLRAARLALVDAAARGTPAAVAGPDIAADAAALADLMAALDSADPLPAGALGDAPDMSAPVAGRIARGFGEPDAAGVPRPGVAVAAADGALVTSPADASVRYVGEIDGYGPVVILEPQRDALIVLAGLGETLVAPGSIIMRDAPVGFLPAEPAAHEVFSQGMGEAAGKAGSKTLYIELRQKGRPVDPSHWMPFDR